MLMGQVYTKAAERGSFELFVLFCGKLYEMNDVFFYGLFMDESVLRAKGVEPRAARKAVVRDYELRIAQRAMLVPQPGSQAFGMVYALTDAELDSLYGEPGLEMYRPESVIATFEDGSSAEVTTFNLSDTTETGEPNLEYAAKLRAVLERLGFPTTPANTSSQS